MGDTNYFHNGYELTFYRLDNYKSLLDYTPPVEEPDALIPDEGTEYEDNSSNLAKYIIIGVSVAVALAIAGAIIWFVIFKKRKKFIK